MIDLENIKSNLRDIIAINRESIENDSSLMNEIVIDELMLDLGYNKKRDQSVKRIHNGQLDWEIKQGGESLIGVKVFALLDTETADEIQAAKEYGLENKIEVLLITNGNTIGILSLDYNKDEYEEIAVIDINEEITDREIAILQAISKEELNLEELDNLKIKITEQDIKNALLQHIGEITSEIKANLQNWLDISNSSLLDKLLDESELLKPEFMFNTESSKLSDEDNTEEEYIDLGTDSSNSEQTKEIERLTEELAKQIEEKTQQAEEIEKQTAEIEKQAEEIEKLQEKIKQQENEIEEINKNKDSESSNTAELAEVQEEVENLQNEVESLKETLADKENLIVYKEKEIQRKIEELNKKEEQTKQLKEDLEVKENELQQFKQQASANENTDENTEHNADEISSYRKQIESLSNELSEYKEKVTTLEQELEANKAELNNLSGVGRQRALELLNVIEDNEELDRHYVGVINTELIQFDSISTFVGRSLQKLYELKAFEASQYIFNGDIFKLVQPAKRNDLIMNNKAYDIDLGNEHEDEVLNKLRIVFSHFEDVIFECKKIGTIKPKKPEIIKKIELAEDEEAEAEEFESSDEKESQEILIAGQLLNIDSLVWSEEDIEFNNIKYVGSDTMTFNINRDNDEMSNEQILCKCIDAVLSLGTDYGDNIVARLKQTDLSTINNFIKLYTTEYASYPRINGTRYVVTGMDSLKQVASVLLDICNEMEIDTSSLFVYFSVTTTSDFIKSNYEFPEDAIQLREFSNYERSEDAEETAAVIKGNMFSCIAVTKNSLKVHRELFNNVLAVKTKYLVKALNTREDLVDIVSEMIIEAENVAAINSLSNIGNVVGESHKLISKDSTEVGDKPIEIVGQAGTYYLATIEDWQVVHSLLKIHTTLFNNMAIALKTSINMEALHFFKTQFETSEPSLSLAVKSIIDYVESCIK